MATKRQHFVPQVYMKAWETQVENKSEPNKKFKGIYVFENDTRIGNGFNRDSILWEPHLYTIGFKYQAILKSCPLVKSDFVDQIYSLLRINTQKPVYGKKGYSKIKTKSSIHKHIYDIHDWDFYYDDGNLAKKKSILNRIYDLNCYVLERAFDDIYEKRWESVCERFINGVQDGPPISTSISGRKIDKESAINMIEFFFMMLCRSPQFDAMGIYTKIKETLLYPTFADREFSDELISSIWHSELYKMFFKKNDGFYNNVIGKIIQGCQMVLFEIYDSAGSFITSDNPAFQNMSVISKENLNGFVFPITPKHLLFIANGDYDSIDVVDYRFADRDTIQRFNKIIKNHKNKTIVANERTIDHLI